MHIVVTYGLFLLLTISNVHRHFMWPILDIWPNLQWFSPRLNNSVCKLLTFTTSNLQNKTNWGQKNYKTQTVPKHSKFPFFSLFSAVFLPFCFSLSSRYKPNAVASFQQTLHPHFSEDTDVPSRGFESTLFLTHSWT